MNEQAADELRMLRTRAYGPDADIGRDSEASRRLQELEDLARAAAADASPGPDSRPDDAAPVPEAVPVFDAPLLDPPEEAAEATAAEAPAAPAPTRPATRTRLIWAASIAVAVLVTAVSTALITREVQSDPREVAVLLADPGVDVPTLFGNAEDEGTGYAEFHGMRAVTITQGPERGAQSYCMVLVETAALEDSTPNSFPAYAAFGCGARGLPLVVSFTVTPQLPEEMRNAFPVGTALQFVVEDTRVTVLDAGIVAEA